MRVLLLIVLFSLVGVFPVATFGASQDKSQQIPQSPSSIRRQSTVSPTGKQTQNQGEDQQLRVTAQEESLSTGAQQEQTKTTNTRAQTAREHMSVVAQQVQLLLSNPNQFGSIGEQVRTIAKAQNQSQQQTQQELAKVESRQGLAKTLIGPNFQSLKQLKQQIEQNQVRIRQLSQLKTQLTNKGEQTQIQETVQALILQNTALQDKVISEESSFSLLGWLLKNFS